MVILNGFECANDAVCGGFHMNEPAVVIEKRERKRDQKKEKREREQEMNNLNPLSETVKCVRKKKEKQSHFIIA